MEKNIKKDVQHVYVLLSHFAVQQQLTQCYKSTIIQLKEKKNLGNISHLSFQVSPTSTFLLTRYTPATPQHLHILKKVKWLTQVHNWEP